MSLLDKIKERKAKLLHTETIVKTIEGKVIKEEYSKDGFKDKLLTTKASGYVIDNKPDLQIAYVTDYLMMGSQDVAHDSNLLKSNKISHVISLGIKVDHVKDIDYTYVDVLDVPEFSILSVFDNVFGVIDKVRRENGRVFVHCNAGVSRSASVVIGYVMKTMNLSFQRAFEFVKAKRSCIKPNEGFVKQLKDYEQIITVEDS